MTSTPHERSAEPLSLTEFSQLIESIYQGPLESPPWKTFLEALRLRLKSSYTTFILRPAAPERPSIAVNAGPTSTENIDLYDNHFYMLDPFMNMPRGQVFVAGEFLGERRWAESEFMRGYMEPMNLRHVMGADIGALQGGDDCRLRVTRSPEEGPFTEEDKAFLRLMLPHVQQSVVLCSHMEQIEIERRLLAGTVDRMQLGTVTLDETGAILSVNAEAQAILDERDGLQQLGCALKAHYAEEQAQLNAIVQAVLSGKEPKAPKLVETVSVTRPSGRNKLSLLVRAVPAGEWSDAWRRPRVVIFVRDPDRKAQGSGDVLRNLFSLTRAEAALALQLANGLTLDEAAEALGIRRNTARAQLRSIFSKMGVTRQTELVRLVLNSVVQLV